MGRDSLPLDQVAPSMMCPCAGWGRAKITYKAKEQLSLLCCPALNSTGKLFLWASSEKKRETFWTLVTGIYGGIFYKMLITGLILLCQAKPNSRSVGNIPLQRCSAITESSFKFDKTLKILDSTQQDFSKHWRLQALWANASLLSHPCPGAETQLEDEEET